MTQFSNKLKKTLFLAHFDHFWGNKKLSWKIGLCHAQLHLGFQHQAKIQKKLMTQLQENVRTDGRMDRQTLFYRTPSAYHQGSKNCFGMYQNLCHHYGQFKSTTNYFIYAFSVSKNISINVQPCYLGVLDPQVDVSMEC